MNKKSLFYFSLRRYSSSKENIYVNSSLFGKPVFESIFTDIQKHNQEIHEDAILSILNKENFVNDRKEFDVNFLTVTKNLLLLRKKRILSFKF
jgi:hypothetical protein